MHSRRIVWLTLFVLTAIGWAGLTAQQTRNWNSALVYVTRQELINMLQRLDAASQSDEYSSRVRDQSRMEADLVRGRLENGDFSTGDRIFMLVEAESALTDTFTVREGPMVVLPDLGDLSLMGVLRSELDAHLTRFIERFIRNPSVQARPLIPITVVGGVANPGFYTVPTDGLFTDVLTLAGGPSATAKINEITVERDGETLYDQEYVAQAIVEGRTIDHLSLQAGDQILVPEDSPGGGFPAVVAIVGAVIAIPVGIIFAVTTINR